MALLTPVTITPSGIAPSLVAAAAGGDTFASDTRERTFLHVKNGHTANITVTIAPAQATVSVPGVGVVTVPNISVVVGANTGEKFIGPFSQAYINASGLVTATYSAVTNLTVEAVVMPAVSG